MKIRSFGLAFLMMFLAVHVHAQELRTVHWVTDNWPGFTQEDGTGLYDQLFSHVFSTQGLELKKTYAPFKRVIKGVDNGKYDFGGGILKEDQPSNLHYQAPFPAMTNEIYIFGRKEIVENPELKATRFASVKTCATHMFDEAAHVSGEVFEVHSKQMAFRMVVLGRCDLFIDARRTVLEVIEQESPNVAGFHSNKFGTKEIGRFSAYMISPRTTRGYLIMDAYIQGTIAAYKNGTLQPIYEKLGFRVPDEMIQYLQNGLDYSQ